MKKEKRSLLRGWKRGMAVMLGIILTVVQLSIPVTAAEETGTETTNVCLSGNILGSGVSGNDIEEASEAVKKLQDFINALPSVDEVKAMNEEDRNAAYARTQEANEAYAALTEEEQTQVDITKIEALFGYFNGQIANMTVLSTETSEYVAEVDGIYYADFMEALNASMAQNYMHPSERTYCKLLKDITVNGNISSSSATNFALDLNGHTLKCNTLYLGDHQTFSLIKGPGTVKGNISVYYAYLYAPLTVYGNILQDGVTKLQVSGSGVFRVNGDIADFAQSSKIEDGVTIVCTGTCNETNLTPYFPKDGSTLIIEPSNLTAIYGQSLSDISLPTGWEWVNKDTSVSVGTQSYPARFNTADYEAEFDFTDVVGYNKDNHYVQRNLSVSVSKGATVLAITAESMDKIYDGNAVAKPPVDKTGSTKDVTFTWYERNGENWTLLSSAPVNAGSYRVVAKVEADDNYSGAESERTFTVTQRQLTDSMIAAIADQYYTGAAIEPDITVTDTAGIKESDYIVSYSDNINVGTATVTITGQNNYTGTASKTFTIENNNASDITPNGGGYTSDKLHTVNDIQTEPLTNFLPLRTINQDEDEKGPFIKGDDGREGWSVIGEQIDGADDGDTVIVDMNGSTTVPGNIIESIADRDITIIFDMGDGITWSVNGKSVTADNIQDINLGVSRDTKNIPVDIINNVTGERYSMTITIEHDGEFGFTAVLTVNMEKKNAGLYASLFYYNKASEELEFMCADEIDAEGNAELSFTHASDYTIVIDKESMDPNRESDNADTSLSDDANTEIPAAPKTGQDTDEGLNQIWVILIGAVIILIGIGGYVFYTIRKKEDDGR